MKLTDYAANFAALLGIVFITLCQSSLSAEATNSESENYRNKVKSLIQIPKSSPETVVAPTNAMLVRPDRGGIALQFDVKNLHLGALLCYADFWISLRKNADVHFVYKGTSPEQRIITNMGKPGLLTCVINYRDGVCHCYVNGKKVTGEIKVDQLAVGSPINTMNNFEKEQALAFTRGIMLSGAPFSEAEIAQLSQPCADWRIFPETTLLINEIGIDEKTKTCEGKICGGIIKDEDYASFIKRSYPQRFFYVDANHPKANDDNAGDSLETPLRTIKAGIRKLGANSTLYIRRGVYPEALFLAKSGMNERTPIIIAAYPGDEEQVILTGADRVVGWTKTGDDLWQKEDWEPMWDDWGVHDPRWVARKSPYNYVKRWRRSWREHLFLDGQDLLHVDLKKNLSPMSFWVDRENRICFMKLAPGLDPNKMELEASRRNVGVKVFGSHLRMSGLVFEKYAQNGLYVMGTECQFNDISTRFCYDGVCVGGSKNIFRNVKAVFNGRCGFTGNPVSTLFSDCLTAYNNTKGINVGFHCGGVKFCSAKGVTIRNMRAEYNRGPGIWFDIDNRDIVIENCQVIGNMTAGIFIEISIGPCLIKNNLCVNNSSGITIAESSDCELIHNTCCYNQNGVRFRCMPRGKRYMSKNVKMSHNIFAFNTKSQINGGGWNAAKPDSDPVAMNYQSDNNLLWSGKNSSAPLLVWGEQSFKSLKDLPSDFRWEKHSLAADPMFRSLGPYDFTLSPKSPAGKITGQTKKCRKDYFARPFSIPSAGAVEPIINEIWSYRSYDGEKEANLWPMPD